MILNIKAVVYVIIIFLVYMALYFIGILPIDPFPQWISQIDLSFLGWINVVVDMGIVRTFLVIYVPGVIVYYSIMQILRLIRVVR